MMKWQRIRRAGRRSFSSDSSRAVRKVPTWMVTAIVRGLATGVGMGIVRAVLDPVVHHLLAHVLPGWFA